MTDRERLEHEERLFLGLIAGLCQYAEPEPGLLELLREQLRLRHEQLEEMRQ